MTSLHERRVLIVRDDGDVAGRLLDEFDTLVGLVEQALLDQEQARVVIVDAELEMAVREAGATLETTGTNEATRRAAVLLALRVDAEYQHLREVHQGAKGALHAAERHLTITKYRLQLVRAALALLAGEQQART